MDWRGNATQAPMVAPGDQAFTPRAEDGPAETSFLPPLQVLPFDSHTLKFESFRFPSELEPWSNSKTFLKDNL